MFVMIAAWRTTDPHDDVENRMAGALADAAVSITVTTFTNLVAIGVGAVSQNVIFNLTRTSYLHNICFIFVLFSL